MISEELQVDIFSFILQLAALWLLMTHFQQTVTRVGLELDGVGVSRGGWVTRGGGDIRGGGFTRGGGVTSRYPRRREGRGGALLMGD